MLIFVEGPAGAGKTSFIKELAKRNPGIKILHEYHFDEDTKTKKNFHTFVKNTAAKMTRLKELDPKQITVVDRGYFSMVANAYAEKKHDINSTYEEALQWLDEYETNPNALRPDVYIYITAPIDLLLSRAKTGGWYRKDLGWTIDPQAAMHEYERLFKKYAAHIPIKRFDGTKSSAKLVDLFEKQITAR